VPSLGLNEWTDADSAELDTYLELLRDPPESFEKYLLPTHLLESHPMLAESHLASLQRDRVAELGLKELQDLFANLPREEDRVFPPDLKGFGTPEFWQGLPTG
jgi:hypothetical protein